MLKQYTSNGLRPFLRQKATVAQIIPMKKIGFSKPSSLPRNSPTFLKHWSSCDRVGCQALPDSLPRSSLSSFSAKLFMALKVGTEATPWQTMTYFFSAKMPSICAHTGRTAVPNAPRRTRT